jgi:prepilin-type N-terminal cleavage/methylation domain-containing protein
MSRQPGADRRTSRTAFTLIEMVVSLSVISIVFMAMGSVMILASKALPTADASESLTLDTGDIMQQMVLEFQTATEILSVSDKSILFKVPDRDGDGADEGVVYYWTGVAGTPLNRIYNGVVTVPVIAKVYEFSLAYDTKTVAQPDSLAESAEVLLSSRAQGSGTKKFSVTMNNWIGQYFQPSALPAGAVTWNVSRVLVKAKTNGMAFGQTRVQLRLPQSGEVLPSTTVLDQVTMQESNLSGSYAWQSFSFSNVQGLIPGEGLCLVLQWVNDNKAADILYNGNVPDGWLSTDNGGSSWNDESGKSMVYYVYGTYTSNTPQPPAVLLKSITLTLNAGESPSSRVLTKVNTLNQPAMP